MSLTIALNTALTSLNVNQQSLAALSQNIANANNPEYSRKVISQEAVYLQGTGAGVRISDIGRKVDDYLQKSVRNQGSDYSYTSTVSDYSDRLQVLLGNPGSQNSVYSYATNFFNALQSLSQTPENASLRVNAVNTAANLASNMSTLASNIHDMQYSLDQEVSQSIDTVNRDLKEIYTLNATISTNKLLGRSTSELEDKRDTLLNEISGVIDIQTYQQTNGVVNVFVAGGYSLLDSNVYALKYNGTTSADFFANNNPTAAINIYRLDDNGSITGPPNALVSSGIGQSVTTQLTSGKMKALLDMRDKQLPDVLAKLDAFAGVMRDQINAVHNAGTAYPGASSYTGTRAFSGEDYSAWTGKMRLAVLDQNGNPVPSNYSNESSGMRPLMIDLSKLDTGTGEGNPSIQGIINEINRYYGVPQNKVELGAVNDVRLVLNNTSIPGSSAELNFDFLLDNISGGNANFYVRDLQVLDDNDTDITDINQDVPTVELSPLATYTTTAGSNVVTVKTDTAHGYKNGDMIYLSPPASNIDGINADNLGGLFTITNVTSTGFDISVANEAQSGGPHNAANVIARSSYYTSETGTNARTKDAGTITANIAANTTSRYYTIKAQVSSVDEHGNVSNSTITYRIDNLSTNVKNYQYAARSATDNGKLVVPNTAVPAMTAKLVDENGVELPIVNNQYTTTQKGYLKLVAGNSNYVIAIDSLDSAELGKPNSDPAVAGSSRGFSHYFELNNLFVQNRSTGVVDDTLGSAAHMAVNKAITSNVNLISVGKLVQTAAPVDPTQPPLYTYERHIGDNSTITQLANFSTKTVSFGAAGDLGSTQLTLTSYAGQIISTAAAKATANKSGMDNSKLLLDGFNQRNDSLRGVNLDEELANTIIYQNAYSASARIITVANQFFDALIEAVR